MNPDVFFQARETINPYYDACAGIVQKAMDRFAKMDRQAVPLFDYCGAPDAERVIVAMCSGAETAEETAKFLAGKGEKVGVVFGAAVPAVLHGALRAGTAQERRVRRSPPGSDEGSRAVGGRCTRMELRQSLKGWQGSDTLQEHAGHHGGRYGLSSKEFTPGMVKAVFDEFKEGRAEEPLTVGIHDDVSHTSLRVRRQLLDRTRGHRSLCVFGLGADGTVGQTKTRSRSSARKQLLGHRGIRYDRKNPARRPRPTCASAQDPSGRRTSSERTMPILWPATSSRSWSGWICCNTPNRARTFLLNSIYGPDEVWEHLPQEVQKALIDKKLRFFVIDGYDVAERTGMGGRVNTIMQTCFFAISGALPTDEAIMEIKKSIKKTYGKRGEAVVKQNFDAVDNTLKNMHEVKVPGKVNSQITRRDPVSKEAPAFVKDVIGPMLGLNGDDLPVSALPVEEPSPRRPASGRSGT